MEPTEIFKLLLDAPLAGVLLWMLIKEQRLHSETRKARDEDNHRWVERFAVVAERVASAVERLEDHKVLARLNDKS